ncbi:hypothetical protein C7T35_33625 [Variovorax sp. WS11]|uniref:hypothetical protein n=1 Tax=Variovorax sp. WS11 TaxID=1105204 RepID=UPI000D0D7F22|nr:hypothetical protein [Variovorax sp. WS11]NDZ17756.1 hypothetical protein [Variovorax sp. WS11]PSL80201.1 hypothetical protein C7T35_33625 [Variovorax sp. WS11]
MPITASSQQALSFKICFPSLSREGRSVDFPCDEAGRVDLDGLDERARWNYLFARAMLGREYGKPSVHAA